VFVRSNRTGEHLTLIALQAYKQWYDVDTYHVSLICVLKSHQIIDFFYAKKPRKIDHPLTNQNCNSTIQNDLFCIRWDIKPQLNQSTQQSSDNSIYHLRNGISDQQF